MKEASFIEKLQSADIRTKRRILVALSAIAMLVVVLLWLRFFGSLVGPVSENKPVVDGRAGGFTIGESVKGGTAFIFREMKDAVNGLLDRFWASRGTEKKN